MLGAGALAGTALDAVAGLAVVVIPTAVDHALRGEVAAARALLSVVQREVLGDGDVLGAVLHAVAARRAGDGDVLAHEVAHVVQHVHLVVA